MLDVTKTEVAPKLRSRSQLVLLSVNGEWHEVPVTPRITLVEVIRETIGLTGTKASCETGTCGACTVLLEGQPVLACLTLAIECDGKHVQTVEGLAEGNAHHPGRGAAGSGGWELRPGDRGFLRPAGGTGHRARRLDAGLFRRCGLPAGPWGRVGLGHQHRGEPAHVGRRADEEYLVALVADSLRASAASAAGDSTIRRGPNPAKRLTDPGRALAVDPLAWLLPAMLLVPSLV